VRRAGLRFALSTSEGLADRSSDPLALPRVAVGADLSLARLSLLASGALGALRGRRDVGYPTSAPAATARQIDSMARAWRSIP
jgi:hypothetical protein